MSEILNVYTPEQLAKFMRDKILADNVGLTNFNEGSNIQSELEAVSLIVSSQGYDYLEALRLAIPLALRTGLGFTAKGAQSASGFFRLFRLPIFYVTYSGADGDVQMTNNGSQLDFVTSGTPADDFTVDFATFNTVQKVIDEINSQSNYSATLVPGKDSSQAPSSLLYPYTNKQIVGASNYLNLSDTLDLTTSSDALVPIPINATLSIEDLRFSSTSSSQIAAGEATSPPIPANCFTAGVVGNIAANAINTLQGKGTISSSISGVEHAINDSAFAGGINKESEDQATRRFQTEIQGLHAGVEFSMEAAVLAIPDVKGVSIRKNFPSAGQNTVIADDGTGALSPSLLAEIQKVLDGDPNDMENYPGFAAAGITNNVEAPTVVPVDVTVVLTRVSTLSDETEIKNAVQTAIEQYTNSLKLGDNVVRSRIIEVSRAAHPAIYDVSLSIPATNVAISPSEIARTGSGSGAAVTVNLNTLADKP